MSRDVPRTHGGHEAAPPPESDPVTQQETRGHTPSEQVQPKDADDQDLYGPPAGQ